MNDMTQGALVAPMATDEEMIDVLVNSLYPGAKRTSAAMVLAYCRAAGLDPLLKPVHIVPMSVKTGGKNNYGNDEYETRDTIMPGVGLYRVNAARTGQYAGQDEPVLGPMQSMTFTATKREWVNGPNGKRQPRDTMVEKTVEFPEWAQVTVYRLVGGFRVAFVAREYWLENYATAGRDSDAPNSMWERRVIGQLVKCAEAQALRKGFPEVGSQPTAEEMEGRVFEMEAPADPPPVVTQPQRLSDKREEQAEAREVVAPVATPTPEPVPVQAAAPAESGNVATPAAAPAPAAQASAPAAPATGEPASDGERKNVLITAKARKVALGPLLAELGLNLNPETLDGLTKPAFKAIKAKLS